MFLLLVYTDTWILLLIIIINQTQVINRSQRQIRGEQVTLTIPISTADLRTRANNYNLPNILD